MNEFTPPKITHDTPIVWARTPDELPANRMSGFVRVPKNKSADLVVFGPGGLQFKFDALWADDPTIDARFGEVCVASRGVFWLGERENELRSLRADIEAIKLEMGLLKILAAPDPVNPKTPKKA